jgi:hypothetical protein
VILQIRQRAKALAHFMEAPLGAKSTSPKDFHAMSSGFSRADTGKNGCFPTKKLDAIALNPRQKLAGVLAYNIYQSLNSLSASSACG